jgi:hypothetical protein
MQGIGKIVIGFGLALSMAAQAEPSFKSYRELLSAFHKAGFENILQVPIGSGANTIRVHRPGDEDTAHGVNEGLKLGTPLLQLAEKRNSFVRIPEFDYVESSSVLSYGEAQAWILEDVFLCYQLSSNFLRNATAGGILHCLVFPMKIQDVARVMSAANPSTK